MRSLRARLLLAASLWSVGLMLMMTFVIGLSVRARDTIVVLHIYQHATMAAAILGIIAGFVLFRGGLAALGRLRRELSDLRAASSRRIDGRYPLEIQPLVDDLNALLQDREQAVARAVAKAGDLAHGLKTPLAVLAQESERLEAAGAHEPAVTIAHEVGRMRRSIDYHLAHARAAASGAAPGARCSIAESVDGLRRTLLRLYAERHLSLDVDVPADLMFKGQREDLDEMLGNVLDNACKWTSSRVRVTGATDGASARVSVEDDGPGLDPSLCEAVLQRGVRADEAAPGTGLGLAIVRDLASLYGGAIALDHSPLGGVRATLTLPAVGR